MEKSKLKSQKLLAANNENKIKNSPNKKEIEDAIRPQTSLRHVNSINSLVYKQRDNITECTDNHSSSSKTKIIRNYLFVFLNID